jgi:putative ABC transport system permease protein
MVVLRLALREIRNHPRFSAFFVVNLALGFVGFVGLDAFESSVSHALESRSRAFLGADVDVRARRALSAEEHRLFDEVAGEGARVANATVLFSMAGGAERVRLAEVYAIDAAFPLYGEIVLEGVGPVGPGERESFEQERGAWVDRALLSQLAVEVGDEIRVGDASFRVQGVVAHDGGRASSGFSIAPRVYLALSQLDATGLVATGSRVQYRRLYQLAAGVPTAATSRALRRLANDPRVEVRTHEEATRDLARVYGAVTDYLGLVALVAVFLAGLGAAYLLREHLARRVKDVAILLSLGATRRQAQLVFVVQLVLLSALAAAIACGLGALLLPAIASFASGFTPAEVELRIGWRTGVTVAGLALVGSVSACLPLLARIRSLRPAELFAEHARPALGRGPRDALLLLPALAAFWGLAVWRVSNLAAGSWFVAVFGASLLVLLLLALAALRGLAALPSRGLVLRLALRALVRSRASSVSSFVAIALCALLIGIAPQLRGILGRDLERPESAALPSLFLFDIQPEQLEPLTRHVEARGTELQRVSPMVRARLDAINDEAVASEAGTKPPAPTRVARSAAEEERRLRVRHYNLTYREHLAGSEVLRDGREFAGRHDPESGEPAELSLEFDFARRLGVGVGDTLDFDVQGVPVSGRVVNLREVRWNSFQPNFFVLFQTGVLEEAPKIFLASVPRLPVAEREALQASITEAFPNVSSVDVTRAVRRLLGLLDQLQWALSSTAALSIIVGLVLVYAVARDQARARRWETNLLKVIGADLGSIRRTIDLEFGLLGFLGAFAGCGASVIASAVLCRFVLEADFHVSWPPLLLTLSAIPLLCALTGRIATHSVLRERPLVLLQSAEG